MTRAARRRGACTSMVGSVVDVSLVAAVFFAGGLDGAGAFCCAVGALFGSASVAASCADAAVANINEAMLAVHRKRRQIEWFVGVRSADSERALFARAVLRSTRPAKPIGITLPTTLERCKNLPESKYWDSIRLPGDTIINC